MDFRLLANGPVRMFWNEAILSDACDWLAGHGYRLAYSDAGEWAGEADMHGDLAFVLDFPDYYGANLDALNDCLRDVAGYEYGLSHESAGLVLVLEHFDVFAGSSPASAQALLDIFAIQSRTACLLGHRMMCLVQSDDPDLRFKPVGATPVMWNDAEWQDSKRRP